jgi:hypothetical protein
MHVELEILSDDWVALRMASRTRRHVHVIRPVTNFCLPQLLQLKMPSARRMRMRQSSEHTRQSWRQQGRRC